MLARLLTPRFAAAVLAMVVVVTASNILVQFPLRVSLGPVDIADILTWGAFTYPLAFLVSDLTNRHFGANTARIVVVIGFAVAVVISAYLSAPRIALASGTAFIVGQFLDISVFQRLRNWLWYLPPLVGSLLGSAIDTLVFFSLAFAPAFMFVDIAFGMPDGSLPFPFAMVRTENASYFEPGTGSKWKKGDDIARREIVQLTGNSRFYPATKYYETKDGRWLRMDQIALFQAPEMPKRFDYRSTKWIDVSIWQQTLVLYEGEKPVYATLVSTGVDGMGDPETTKSTIRGEFRIDYKHVTATMDADDPENRFELRDVPWVQYFERGYALHTAYWHDDFGRPRSHGCVNIAPIDARRIFFWTDPPLPPHWHGVKSGEATGQGTWVRVRG